ncbi:LamG domain-containing protein [Streptomyces sp. WMMB 322]|uniref:LamG domain-containing protein n=1 Tax=Streptomyces sp. WMMB 322 TaxID=1286821 RepID=UPI0006E30509|nr:LamG domain-containing protein [Streptomyces sp. WMMB 322]SCK28437.1 DNA-directed RNA polymerase specialized sigma subunit, sigma24 family [Streptomyces sp. WMMB 322]
MEWAQLSDAELLSLVREEGESSPDALRELQRRHFQAVKAFAAVCTVGSSAAEELAGNAWRRATTALRADPGVGAVRPHALCSVLRTTADWAGTAKREDLHEELVSWIQSYVSEGRGDSSADDFPRTSRAARAFGSLPAHAQTVLWHYAVEYDGVARIDQLLGGGTDEVSVLGRRARRDFYNAYVRMHQDEMREDECRRLQRTVLAYADQKSIETAADLLPHLERCAHCSQAVDDLGLMHVHCGALLAEALLPWGGPEYAASSLPSSAGARAAHGSQDDTAARTGAAGGAGDGERIHGDQHAGGWRGLMLRWSGGRAGGRLLGGDPGADDADARPGEERRRHRTRRVVQSAALVAACSLVVAVAYTGAFRPGSPQSAESPPARGGSQVTAQPARPSPTTATATATATVTATETAPPRGNGGGRPGGSGSEPPRGVPAVDTALEWLFDTVQGATTADSSANGILGTLFGDPLPALLNGALQFNGSQDVSSEGGVLDTASSFSVSVRVKLQDKGGSQTVVSQDGRAVSGFSLRYDAAEDRWAMAIRGDDSSEAGQSVALSDSSPEVGSWTRLTGVYDDPGNVIRLYVDGRLEDTVRHGRDWRADGAFTVGRGLLDGVPFQGLRGTVDEVRAFGSALSGQQVRDLAGRS